MEEVADVDDEGPGERGDGDPSGAVGGGRDLEAAGGALVEDGEEGGVGVLGEAHGFVRLRTSRVRVQLQRGVCAFQLTFWTGPFNVVFGDS